MKRTIQVLLTVVALFAALCLAAFRAWHLNHDDAVIIRFGASSMAPITDIGLFLRNGDYSLQTCCDHSSEVVRGVSGSIGFARRFELRTTDALVRGSFRSELRLRPNHLREDFWYQSRIFVPADWTESSTPVVAMQWHNTRDFFLGESGNIPPLALDILRGEWRIVKAWDKRWISPETPPRVQGHQVVASVPLSPGTWSEWTFHVRWSPDSDGFVQVWKDGRLIADVPGPIGHQDLIGPYLKAGIYIPGWKDKGRETAVSKRVLYFDLIAASGSAERLPLSFTAHK